MPSMEVIDKQTTNIYEILWAKATAQEKPISLRELINFDWTTTEQSVNNFIEFLVNLVTYKSTLAFDCYSILTSAFEPYKLSLQTQTAVQYNKWEAISLKVHFALNKILSTIPMSSTVLAKIIVDKFPHKTHTAEVLHFFLKNSLYVTRYCPSITETILSSVVSLLVQIDVSITLEAIPDDDDLQFLIEDNEKQQTPELLEQIKRAQQEKASAQKLDILMNLTLDYLSMRFGEANKSSGNMFYFDGCEQMDRESQDGLFNSLVKIFDSTILPTYKSKYTQYLIFSVSKIYQRSNIFPPLNTNISLLNQNQTPTHNNNNNFLVIPNSSSSSSKMNLSPSNKKNSILSTSTSPSKRMKSFLKIDPILITSNSKILYSESFIRYLFSKLVNEKIHNMYKHACAAYIGGFISRASYLPNHLIKMAFRDLLHYALQYVDKYDKKEMNCFPDPQIHSLFYSVCQSVYYIFCFRNQIILDFTKDFKNDKKGDKQREFWQDLNEAFRKISMSRLNPFKICLKSVVRQFASVCLRVGIFAKCVTILRNNKKISISSKTATGQINHFDSFFPFDPYILPHSQKHFQDIYVEWKSISQKGDDENLDDLSDGEDSEDEEDQVLSSDSEFSDFESESESELTQEEEESDSEDEDEEVDQLAEDLMSFTPELRFDLKYHMKNRDY